MANQKILDQKQAIVDEITEKVKSSTSVVVFEYASLTDGDLKELRRKLRETGSDFKIYKNTLARRALSGLNYELDSELVGPKAIAFGNDAIAPVKTLSEFSKSHDALVIKTGIVDGEIASLETLNMLATVPSRDTLLTQLAAGLMGVVRDLSISLDLYSKDLEKAE
ncbi:MAG: 50S ribosomal protein L10 [Firmicutes bacterium]|nr:50S ribosomal protein L10 [Bacillota bacterium]